LYPKCRNNWLKNLFPLWINLSVPFIYNNDIQWLYWKWMYSDIYNRPSILSPQIQKDLMQAKLLLNFVYWYTRKMDTFVILKNLNCLQYMLVRVIFYKFTQMQIIFLLYAVFFLYQWSDFYSNIEWHCVTFSTCTSSRLKENAMVLRS
jgi:hypothetical protein